MLSLFAKTALVLTSLAPVLVTYALARFPLGECPQYWLSAVALVLVLVCLGLLRFATHRLQAHAFEIASIRNADQEILAFILAYLLPLVGGANEDPNIAVSVFVFVLIFIAVFNSNSYHFNPLLGLFGYHFYEVTTPQQATYIILTRRRMRATTGTLSVVELSDYLLLEAQQ